jgi:hypothetical protein
MLHEVCSMDNNVETQNFGNVEVIKFEFFIHFNNSSLTRSIGAS